MADELNEINGVKKYSTKQVADLLKIDKSTLLRWIRQGKIKDVTHRDGRNWRVWLIEDVRAAKEYHDSIHSLMLNLAYEGKREPGAPAAPAGEVPPDNGAEGGDGGGPE